MTENPVEGVGATHSLGVGIPTAKIQPPLFANAQLLDLQCPNLQSPNISFHTSLKTGPSTNLYNWLIYEKCSGIYVKVYCISYQSIQTTTFTPRNVFQHYSLFFFLNFIVLQYGVKLPLRKKPLHNGYVLAKTMSFKMGIIFNPQHTHPGKLGMKLPPPPPLPRPPRPGPIRHPHTGLNPRMNAARP